MGGKRQGPLDVLLIFNPIFLILLVILNFGCTKYQDEAKQTVRVQLKNNTTNFDFLSIGSMNLTGTGNEY
jgi:hypothetical protein